MKNIDEAIKHAEEKAKELYCKADEDFFFDGDWGKKIHCTECAKEHEQLANWLKELKMLSWIPVTTRDLSAEEIEELVKGSENMFAPDEIEHWCFDCRLPDDNQEVIVSTQWGVRVVTFYADYDYGCYFEGYEDRDDVLAWMPLPEPYTKEENS